MTEHTFNCTRCDAEYEHPENRDQRLFGCCDSCADDRDREEGEGWYAPDLVADRAVRAAEIAADRAAEHGVAR